LQLSRRYFYYSHPAPIVNTQKSGRAWWLCPEYPNIVSPTFHLLMLHGVNHASYPFPARWRRRVFPDVVAVWSESLNPKVVTFRILVFVNPK